jgi:16S rRNA (adenine(1408)-N(1))-methyltransferase
MEEIVGKKAEVMTVAALRARCASYAGVLVDVGTGSGRFVYEMARRHPDLLCIGVDAAAEALREYSAKARRKPARGGVPNALFVRGAAEGLPPELDGLATRLTVNLPWGSLLRGVVRAEPEVLHSLLRAAAPGATLEVLFTYSARYEPAMMRDLALPEPTAEYLETTLRPAYAALGLVVTETAFLDNDTVRRLPLDWGRRLSHTRQREFVRIVARHGGRP